jgi:hypothetical protein
MSGESPWTFFAFPRVLADTENRPVDEQARRILLAIQQRGVPAATWVSPLTPGVVYFACPYESRKALNDAIELLERQGEFEIDFLAKRSEYLFSLVEKSPDAPDVMDSPSSSDKMKPQSNS